MSLNPPPGIPPRAPSPAPGPQLLPPDALAVRLMAEWAGGVRNTPLWFLYEEALHLRTAEPGWGPVKTSADVHLRHAVQSVSLAIPGVAEPLTIAGSAADALLWGEGAVEKFLFPYYASVAGWRAAELLDKLSRAWYGYAADAVQVVALAHACGPAPRTGLVTDAATVQVVFTPMAGGVPGPLQVLGLDEFLAGPFFGSSRPGRARGVTGPSGVLGSVPLTPGNGGLSAIPARELAEFASGVRGQYLYFTLDGNSLVVNACPGARPCPGISGGDPVVFTPLRRPDRPAPEAVAATVDGTSAPLLGPGADGPAPDSLFWTDGAVEQLMLPYYASVAGRHSPFVVPLLLGKWNGLLSPGAPDDVPLAIQAVQAIAADPPPDRRSTVFGLVHLPRSEYVPETLINMRSGLRLPPQTLEFRTRLLTWGPDGFRAEPLRQESP